MAPGSFLRSAPKDFHMRLRDAELGQCAEGSAESLKNAILAEALNEVISSAFSPNTLRAYENCFRNFESWCEGESEAALPATAEAVCLFLVYLWLQGRRASTVLLHLHAIAFFHRQADLETPTSSNYVRTVVRGIRRLDATPTAQKSAATAEHIAAMLSHASPNLLGLRDKALLLIGFAGALRRSELAGIQCEHLNFVKNGLEILLPKSKTDVFGCGSIVAIPAGSKLRPVDALENWLRAADVRSGAVFRGVYRDSIKSSGINCVTVARVVKRLAARAGLEISDFSGHSLRAGFITSAAERGVSIDRIMLHSRHADPRSVLRYIRIADKFSFHAGADFL